MVLHSVKIGVCVVRVPPIIGPTFFQGSVNSDWYVRVILNPLFNQLTVEGRHCGYFSANNAAAYTADTSIANISTAFEKKSANNCGHLDILILVTIIIISVGILRENFVVITLAIFQNAIKCNCN